MSGFQASYPPHIPLSRIHEEAEKIRRDFWPSGDLPVDIDLVIEKMGIDIVATGGLREQFGCDAYLSRNLKEIAIDRHYYMDDKQEFRVRFSLAHELGHKVLHSAALLKLAGGLASSAEWVDSVVDLFDDQRDRAYDREADEFAGRLLVPRQELAIEAQPWIERAQKEVTNLAELDDDNVRDNLAIPLHRHFQVSQQVVAIRLRKEKIYPPIG